MSLVSSLVAIGLAACTLFTATLAGTSHGEAQRRRRPPNIPIQGTTVDWTLFVSPHGATPAHRGSITPEPGSIAIPETAYQCVFGAPNRAAVTAQDWSETRSIECRFGSTTVSTSGFCQVSGAVWGARAAVLYLSEDGTTERITLTLDCAVQPPA